MPIVDSDSIYIESVSARTLNEANEKFLRKIEEIYDLDVHADLEDLSNDCAEYDIFFGEIYDAESF